MTLKFAGGEHVVKQGEHADAIYIIKEGKVSRTRRRGVDVDSRTMCLSLCLRLCLCLCLCVCLCVCVLVSVRSGGGDFAFADLYACMQVVAMRRGSDDKFPLKQNDSFGESALNEDLVRST